MRSLVSRAILYMGGVLVNWLTSLRAVNAGDYPTRSCPVFS